MGNPYEGMPNVNPYETDSGEAITDFSGENVDTSASTVTPIVPSQAPERVSLDTRKARVQHYKEKRQIKKLPEGPERDSALNNWALKYYGQTWDQYSKEMEARKPTIRSTLANRSVLYNNEMMRAPAVGAIDFGIDAMNLTPGVNIPKLPEFEQEGATALREISSILVPFFILREKAVAGSLKIHGAKMAPIWMQRLGNNPIFARLAKTGLDLGVGAFVDATVETNKTNDTLATSWKRGKWWGHNLIPENWTSDKLDPDEKHRANVLEGVRLGFYTEVAEAFVRLFRAGRSTKRVANYLSESGNQKGLDELIIDPLDNQVFDTDVVLDTFKRSDAKYQRDVDALTNYWSTKTDELTKPTIGVHNISDELKTGIRVKDSDNIVGAAADQARISLNKGTTNGRLSNMLDEATRKAGAGEDAIRKRTILRKLRNDLLKAGPYSVSGKFGKLTWNEINREGTILAEIISDPTLPRGQLNTILNSFKETVDGVKKLNPVGYNAVNKASKNLLEDWSDITHQKATAYFLTSEAGQISDIAEGARYMKGTPAVGRAHEQILDRLELFEIESAISDFNFRGRQNLLAAMTSDPKNAHKYIGELSNNFDSKLSEIIPKAQKFRETLHNIQLYNPEFAESLRLAYELSDGNVQTIKALNKYIENTLGTYSKAVIDKNYKIPSLVNKALMTNVFNSILSALGTPVKALYGNFGGFISEPVTVMYGALRSGDAVQMRRAAHMYFGFSDTFQNGFNYMGKIFRKASTDPGDLSNIFRADIKLERLQSEAFANEVASAAAKKGEYGPKSILSIYNELQALAEDPVLRFGPNAMTALDGFTEATQKVAQDKGLAFDTLMRKYPDGKWGAEEFQELWKEIYQKNWDADGLIRQDSVEYARREIGLNLDTPLVKRLNPILKEYPILRSIFWFPTTQANALEIFGKYGNPSRVKIGTDFAGDYAELLGPFGRKSVAEIVESGDLPKILAKRGMDMSGDPIAKLKHLRNKVRGRVAAGNLAVFGALILGTQGRIRGNGHWDPQVQKVRLSEGWVKKTYQGLDGKWHSYEHLGPLGDWLALTTDVLDNFSSINTATFETHMKKMAFILGASLTDRSLLGDIEPLFAVISGNETQGKRWVAQMTNALFPLSNFRNELGKNMFGMLREVSNDDIGEMIRNRNNYLDLVDPEGALGPIVSFVTGEPVKKDRGFWGNARKNIFGFGGDDNPHPLSQFLIDIEYDMMPHFNVSDGGVPYTSQQKAELRKLLGDDGYFHRRLKDIYEEAGHMVYTDPETKQTIKGYVAINHYLRRKGYSSADFPEWGRVNHQIDVALRRAINRVEGDVTGYHLIRQQELLKHQATSAAARQDQEGLDEALNLKNK